MPSLIQASFARGELSPTLYGRVDTAAYLVGLRTAWNTIIHSYGGASNRGGLAWIGPQKEHTYAARLIPFKFKTTDTYVLEFGDLYMRVIRNDSHVTEPVTTITGITQADPGVATTSGSHGYSSGDEVALATIVGMTELNGRRVKITVLTGTTFSIQDQVTSVDIDTTGFTAYSSAGTAAKIFEIVTPYAKEDLAIIKFTQSADVMTLTHPTYRERELSRTDHDAWTLAEIQFTPTQAHPTSLAGTQNGATGSETYRYKITALGEESEESLPGVISTSQTITNITQADPAVVTTSAVHGMKTNDEVLIEAVVGMTEVNDRWFRTVVLTTTTYELVGEDSTNHTAYSSAGTAKVTDIEVTDGNATLSATDNITLTFTAAALAQRYVIYKEDNGLFGFLGETEDTTYVDDGSIDPPDVTSTPPRPREPFRGDGNAPGAVGYYEQRRVFGGSTNRPDTSDYSRTADQSNFTTATPTQADDAIRATLTSREVNQIRHYVPLTHLLILTSGEEWRVDSGENNRFSADTFRQKPQSRWGCGHQRPITIGNVVLFVQESDINVRSIGYEFAIDGYAGTDMTLLANHIFRDHTIVDWAYARTPDPIIHLVRSDGKAATLTFNQEQEVIAWTRWGTRSPDKFEAVTTSRPTDQPAPIFDEAYFVVERTINGQGVRYIEHTHRPRQFVDVRDAFFVDCGFTFDNPLAISGATQASPVVLTVPSGHGLAVDDEVDVSDIVWVLDVDEFDTETQPAQLNDGRFKVKATTATTVTLKDLDDDDIDGTAFNAYVEGGNIRKAVSTLSGAHHLAGETIIALADGSVVRDLTVDANGGITLPRKFSRVHGGFGYFSDVELLNIEAPGAATIQHMKFNVYAVTVRLERSRGLWFGPDASRLTELKQRQDEPYGSPIALFTGDRKVTIPASWKTNGRVLFRQRDPLPMTILAAIPHFQLQEGDE